MKTHHSLLFIAGILAFSVRAFCADVVPVELKSHGQTVRAQQFGADSSLSAGFNPFSTRVTQKFPSAHASIAVGGDVVITVRSSDGVPVVVRMDSKGDERLLNLKTGGTAFDPKTIVKVAVSRMDDGSFIVSFPVGIPAGEYLVSVADGPNDGPNGRLYDFSVTNTSVAQN